MQIDQILPVVEIKSTSGLKTVITAKQGDFIISVSTEVDLERYFRNRASILYNSGAEERALNLLIQSASCRLIHDALESKELRGVRLGYVYPHPHPHPDGTMDEGGKVIPRITIHVVYAKARRDKDEGWLFSKRVIHELPEDVTVELPPDDFQLLKLHVPATWSMRVDFDRAINKFVRIDADAHAARPVRKAPSIALKIVPVLGGG